MLSRVTDRRISQTVISCLPFFLRTDWHFFKDLSKVKPLFKSVPLQIYFEIAGLASAEKWRKIQNIIEEESFQSQLLPC